MNPDGWNQARRPKSSANRSLRIPFSLYRIEVRFAPKWAWRLRKRVAFPASLTHRRNRKAARGSLCASQPNVIRFIRPCDRPRRICNRPRNGWAFWVGFRRAQLPPAEGAGLRRDQLRHVQAVPAAPSPLRQPKPVQHPVFALVPPDRLAAYLASAYRPLHRVVRPRDVPPPAMA